MPFNDSQEGQTHSFNDGCGEKAHNFCDSCTKKECWNSNLLCSCSICHSTAEKQTFIGEPEATASKGEKGLPCPHGRLPYGNVDGWHHCPHCLGINGSLSVPTPEATPEKWERICDKEGCKAIYTTNEKRTTLRGEAIKSFLTTALREQKEMIKEMAGTKIQPIQRGQMSIENYNYVSGYNDCLSDLITNIDKI